MIFKQLDIEKKNRAKKKEIDNFYSKAPNNKNYVLKTRKGKKGTRISHQDSVGMSTGGRIQESDNSIDDNKICFRY